MSNCRIYLTEKIINPFTCAPPCCREDWPFWPHCWCWRKEEEGGRSISCWGELWRRECPDQTGQSPGHSYPPSSPADWDLKQRNICVWLSVINTTLMTCVNIPLLEQWQCLWEISPRWRRTVRTLRREQRTLQHNISQVSTARTLATFLLPRWQWRLSPGNTDELKVMMFTWDFSFSLSLLFLSKHCSSNLQ